MIQEAWIGGVSTRKVDDQVQALGRTGISKSQVLELCGQIDERVPSFLSRPIEGEWPNLWLDATDLKVRQAGRVGSVAAIIACAVNSDGRREILGLDIGESEAKEFWPAFLRGLRQRGLSGVKRIISDAHEGLKAAALLDEAEEDLLADLAHPAPHRVKLHSTNTLKRLNKEVKGRANVVGIFPNEASILRLTDAVLMEQNEVWQLQHRYMS